LKLADHSYDVPPSTTTTTNLYTGKQTVTTQPGYHIENKTIDITIKNQPFVSSSNFNQPLLWRSCKRSFWRELDRTYPYFDDSRPDLQLQSASENTLISTPQDYPAGGQVDFQVEAIIVTIHPLYNINFAYWGYETSDWSNTQTLSIPASEPTATPNNSLSPTTSVTTIWLL
jgi:hypothetical protein